MQLQAGDRISVCYQVLALSPVRILENIAIMHLSQLHDQKSIS